MNRKTQKSAILGLVFVWITGFIFGGIKQYLQTENVYVLAAPEPPRMDVTIINDGYTKRTREVPQKSNSEVEEYILEVFKEDSDTALAIAKAESGLNPRAYNDNRTWEGVGEDLGIFQINNVYHPEVTEECAYDFKCNIDYAYKVFRSWHGWNAWSAYKNKAYLNYL